MIRLGIGATGTEPVTAYDRMNDKVEGLLLSKVSHSGLGVKPSEIR